jgi:hypothetical protein
LKECHTRIELVWSIVRGFPRDRNLLSSIDWLSIDPPQYKHFPIDVEAGELVAMKLREVALRLLERFKVLLYTVQWLVLTIAPC